MRKLAVLAALPLAALALAAAASGGKAYSFKAKLDGKSEVPPATAPAKAAGNFKATVKESYVGGTLKWTLTFRNLSGPASGGAHIHLGKPGVAGDVLVALCGPCKTGAHGTVKVTTEVIAALEKGEAYVNVHTAKNPAGEIRGQIRG